MERYIKEYANARIKDAKSNNLMRSDIKESIINKIEHALKARERGFITVSETIKMILEA